MMNTHEKNGLYKIERFKLVMRLSYIVKSAIRYLGLKCLFSLIGCFGEHFNSNLHITNTPMVNCSKSSSPKNNIEVVVMLCISEYVYCCFFMRNPVPVIEFLIQDLFTKYLMKGSCFSYRVFFVF